MFDIKHVQIFVSEALRFFIEYKKHYKKVKVSPSDGCMRASIMRD
jgi:hypothetical protein